MRRVSLTQSHYLFFLLLLLSLLLLWSYPRLGYLTIDTGGQWYISWRLAEGDLLYRDVWHAYGPLSVYWNGLWFFLLGAKISTIYCINGVFLYSILLLLFLFFQQISSQGTAFILAVSFLCIFGISQNHFIGEYNYITPYSQELVHGLGIFLLMMLLTRGYLQRVVSSGVYAFIGGVLLGLSFLLKYEPFVAVTIVFVGAFFFKATSPFSWRVCAKIVLTTLAGFLLPLTSMAFLFLLQGASWRQSLHFLWLSWEIVLASSHSAFLPSKFYREVMGLENLTANLATTLGVLFTKVVLVGGVLGSSRVKSLRKLYIGLAFLLAGGVVLLFFFFSLWKIVLLDLWPTSLNVELLLLSFGCFYWREKFSPYWREYLLWNLGSCAFLAKIWFSPDIHHYGFVLTAPALLSEFFFLLHLLPQKLPVLHRRPIRLVNTSFVLLFLFTSLYVTHLFFSVKQMTLQSQSGELAIYSSQFYPEGAYEKAFLKALEKYVPPQSTLAIYPRRHIFNFLSRRKNSLACFEIDPVILASYTLERYFQDFEKSPPQFIGWCGNFPRDIRTPAMDSFLGKIAKSIERQYILLWDSSTPSFPCRIYIRKDLSSSSPPHRK